MITREQAHLIALLVQTIRTGWDTRAINAVLADMSNLDLADVAHAAIRTAQDHDMRTPAAIGFLDGKHWRPTVRDTETPEQVQARAEQARGYSREARNCSLCDAEGWLPSGVRCPHDGLSADERAERHRKAAAAARAEIRRPRLASLGNPQKPAEPTGDVA